MRTPRSPFRPELRGTGAALVLSVLLASGAAAAPRPAGDGPGGPAGPAPSVRSVFEGEVDTGDPDLRLPPGGTLAAPKVLEIARVVGDEGGREQREDSPSSTTFTLQAEVLFGKDSARLGPDASARIERMAEEIRRQGATEVDVFGFTDDLGSYEHGEDLSKRRARAVHRELLEYLGPGVTFDVRGYSEDMPVADNSTEEGRRKNRRVEVSFPRQE